jgi:two-component system, chemotaxis family, protein-glutamate methylesterase/glutaminase
VVVQDPDDALFPSMPRAAIELTTPDRVVSAGAMARALCELIEGPVPASPVAAAPDPRTLAPADRAPEGQDRVEIEDPSATAQLLDGPPSALTCPECGGALWEQENGQTIRYACHVGHAYTLSSLVEEQGRELETTLWSAVRSLEERADVHRRLAQHTRGSRTVVYERRAREAEHHARSLRQALSAAGRLAAPTAEEA